MATDREAEYRPRSEDDLFRIKRAAELWHSAKDPQGTIAENYLRSRALKLSGELAYSVLRFHPRCPWRDEDAGLTEIPALLAEGKLARVAEELKKIGYAHVTLDLLGYRRGSTNEVLGKS